MRAHIAFALCILSTAHADSVGISAQTLTKYMFGSNNMDASWIWSWLSPVEGRVSIVDRSPAVTFLSRAASFGGELNNPLLGYVIPLSSFTVPCASENATIPSVIPPNSGCPKLCIGPGGHAPEPSESWIALVQRGNCSFVDKVRESQRLGARAVVVGGDDPQNPPHNPDMLLNMYSPTDSHDVHIPSTFIKYSDYIELSEAIATSSTWHSGMRTLSLLLTTEYSAWDWWSPILTFTIVLLLPSILTFITLLIHRVRASRAAQLERAPEDIVHNLPWRKYTGKGWEKHEGSDPVPAASADVDLEQGLLLTPEDGPESSSHDGSVEQPWFENQMECAICLSEFVKGDVVRVLPCHHIFHLDEVDGWLIERKKLCPICKHDVTSPLEALAPSEALVDPSAPVDQDTPNETTPLLPPRNA